MRATAQHRDILQGASATDEHKHPALTTCLWTLGTCNSCVEACTRKETIPRWTSRLLVEAPHPPNIRASESQIPYLYFRATEALHARRKQTHISRMSAVRTST